MRRLGLRLVLLGILIEYCVAQASCEFGGRPYKHLHILNVCTTICCVHGVWIFGKNIDKECKKCYVTNDPHFTTFDDQRYDWHGRCQYSITQPGLSTIPSWYMHGQFSECTPPSPVPTCLDVTTFKNDVVSTITFKRLTDTKFTTKFGDTVLDKLTTTPQAYGEGNAFFAWKGGFASGNTVAEKDCVTIVGSQGLMIHYCGWDVHIWATKSLQGTLYGLCGFNDGILANDFTDRRGRVTNRDKFAKSWKIKTSPPCSYETKAAKSIQRCETDGSNIYRQVCSNKISGLNMTNRDRDITIENCAQDQCIINLSGSTSDAERWLNHTKKSAERHVVIRSIEKHHSVLGDTKYKCIRQGNRFGVSAYCLAKEHINHCTGRLYSGKKYCSDFEKYGCCVPKKGPNVNAAFTLTNENYTEALTDHSSAEYKALVEKVKEEVLAEIPVFLNFSPAFFRNGSVIGPDGRANSIIVCSRVITNKENQNKANKFVKYKLKKSGVPGLDPSSVSVGVHLCVAGYQASRACIAMKENYPQLNIICVEARDRYECIQWLNEKQVDVVRADVEDIYLAKEMFGDALSVVAETRDKKKKSDPYEYRIVAVVRKSIITNGIDSLRGSKFCSTGYGHHYCPQSVLFSKLLAMGEMHCPPNGSVLEQNLEAFSSYFGEACLPGQWGPIKDFSNHLKRDVYSNLCSLCDNPDTCEAPAGPEGALQCLNSNGDVAWTHLEAVDEFSFEKPEEFGFLCLDGSVESLDSPNPCIWAGKPWPGWLIRADEEEADVMVSTLRKAANKAKNPMKAWAEDVIGITKPSVIYELDPPLSPYNYLNQGGYYITISHHCCGAYPVDRKRRQIETSRGSYVKFCVTTDIALKKCTELSQVLESRRVSSLLSCVKEDDCTLAIVNGNADFVTLDGGDVFTNYRKKNTIPVISEVYDWEKAAASYYAVAVVRADSGITTLADLKGKKSCHTGIDKTAGWNMPLSTLLNTNLINKTECDYPGQIGRFFKESCAPGALEHRYNPSGTNPESLCDLCIGHGELEKYNCARNNSETFYGYTGAFKCLVNGGGDVAFVKHTTVPANTKPECKQEWCKDLNSSNYRLLCKNGGLKEVNDYQDCSTQVPSHMVVTGYNTGDVLRSDIRNLLLETSKLLPQGNDVFVLFGDYNIYHDLLFKNSATGLIDLPKTEFAELQNSSYWEILGDLENCK